MPRQPDSQLVAELLAKWEPELRSAFLDAVADIRDSITLRVIVERLERGDVEGAIRAMNLEPEAFARLERVIAEAYYDGGQATVGNLPLVRDPDGSRIVFRFAVRNPEAEAWLRQHSSGLVTRTTDDMRQAIRQHLTDGLAQGQNPRQTALQVVGRVDRASNRRTGGVIGLTAQQETFVSSARRELLSGDPEAMRHYLTRGRRDKRFDRAILKAIREERPLDSDTVVRIAGRYSDRLLQLRGESIGLSETMTAIARSRHDAIGQQIAAGKLEARDVVKVWKTTPQEHPRLHHRAMNGKSVPWGEQFELPNGVRMDYPHAPDAPAGETLFCKCTYETRIAFAGALVRRYRAEAA
ncbi:head morphogenesis protein [Mesorhizobium sp. Z1-4]|uniref:head morphogenesis protein n=1 Tax=Mesorhizobium sp. Z1-4 TaxID=2448478 RepID=UPI000FDCBB30|nr:head morphogenesis protein [Mesorhizobium sp. Z1-4]